MIEFVLGVLATIVFIDFIQNKSVIQTVIDTAKKRLKK